MAAAAQRCMNAVCGAAAPPQGGEWRKGWPLRSGGYAALCDKCGYCAFPPFRRLVRDSFVSVLCLIYVWHEGFGEYGCRFLVVHFTIWMIQLGLNFFFFLL